MSVSQLHLPMVPVQGGVSTGNLADLVLTFENVPLVASTQNGVRNFFMI